MQNLKPVSTPLATHIKISNNLSPKNKKEAEEMSVFPYSSAVGSLMYPMVCTCPNISQAVNVVSKYMGSPSKIHWQVVI